MFNKFLIAMMLITSTQSFAGQDGNGGFGLSCNGKIQLLDLYEAKELYRLNVDLGPANLSVDQKVELMLKRLERINPYDAREYRKKYADLWSRAMVLEGKNVVNGESIVIGETIGYVADIGSTILPTNCQLIPLARNINNDLEISIYFFGKYWKILDNDTKAALILHELVYFDLPGYVKDSSSTRRLISLIASREADTLPLDKLFEKYYGSGRVSPALKLSLNGYTDEHYYPGSQLSDDGTYFKVLVSDSTDAKMLKLAEGQPIKTWLENPLYVYNKDGKIPFIDRYTPRYFTTDTKSIVVGGETYKFAESTTDEIDVSLHDNKVVKSLYAREWRYIRSPTLEKIRLGKDFSHEPQLDYVQFSPEGVLNCVGFRIKTGGRGQAKVRINGSWMNMDSGKATVDSRGKLIKNGCDQ